MKVRQYVADGQGEVKIQTVSEYPHQLSGRQLSHTVQHLSKCGIQWNLRTKDTLRQIVLSPVERLSLSRR